MNLVGTSAPPCARALALAALCARDPAQKVALALALQADALAGRVRIDPAVLLQPEAGAALPGRPDLPTLIPAQQMPRRNPRDPRGHAALLHAIAHIEFNAINLALDAVWRFADMPEAYYRDWARVAAEEAYHFDLLHTHLQGMAQGEDGQPRWRYGSFAAHDGLWAMCEKTRDDLLARMALVPRTLEARGLDATPLIQDKLRAVASDDALAACALLDIILRDEVGHVAIGNHWYRWLCAQAGHDPVALYPELVTRHDAPRLKGPFNLEARARAGFSEAELQALAAG